VVKITAEVALTQVEQTETQYDPDKTAIRSETSLEEKDSKSNSTPTGVPGVQANLPGGPTPTAGNAEGGSQRKSYTRNYEVNKTVRKRVSLPGELQRLSVAVLIDKNVIIGNAQSAKGVGSERGLKGKPAAKSNILDINALEQVVKQAVGFTPLRGDVVTLQSVYFAPEQKIEPSTRPWLTYVIQNGGGWLKIGLGVGGTVIILLWLLSQLRRQLPQSIDLMELPKTVRELETGTSSVPTVRALGEGGGETPSQALDLAKAAAEHDAVRTASVLRAWMSGGE
jgi:flagellar M-ring protein FliF